jgi:ferritin-like metal-binding protein YciE
LSESIVSKFVKEGAMPLRNLEDAFVDEMKDMLHAEKQILKALPRMAKKTSHAELKEAFEQHRRQTEEQIHRIEQAFESVGRSPRTKKCEGMEGILDEGKDLLKEKAEPDVLDAMLIAAAQKTEHYEIAAYGTLCTWAEMLGHDEAARLLKQNLSEEKETDEKLTQIAESLVNQEAMA